MFKKLVVAFILAVASMVASAGDTVKVMYVGIPQVGPAITFINSYSKNLPVDYKFVSMKDCELAVREVENSDDVIFLISSTNTITATKHNIDCVPKFKPEDLVFISYSYFDYCYKAGSKKDIFKERINIGSASIVPMDGMAKDMNENNGTHFVSVPYSSSVATSASIINGDIDWESHLRHSHVNRCSVSNSLNCIVNTNIIEPKPISVNLNILCVESR